MRAQRTFIDWRRPALAAVVDFVCTRYQRNGVVDLSNVVVVTPGGRAGRRFLELLAERTAGRNIAPQLATPGDLPERLYPLKRPLANDLTQSFAWVEALRGLSGQQVKCIVGDPPADSDVQAWLTIGELLARVHRELAADRQDFRHVADLPLIREVREEARWRALAAAQQRYLAILDGLGLWDQQTARLVAIDKNEPATDCDILLIGLADLNGTLRAMLEAVADRVHVFVHAPEELADRFDDFGVLRPELWEQATIPLGDDCLTFVDRPPEQAADVVNFVRAQAAQGAAADDIVIGLADDSLASAVRVALDEQGVRTRWIGGRTADATSIARLLSAVADRLENDLTPTTCELLRHPDVAAWLEADDLAADWLAQVDRAVIDHAPRKLGGGNGQSEPLNTSRTVADRINRLLRPLSGDGRPLGDWCEPILQMIAHIYGARTFGDDEADQRERQALEFLHDALQQQSEIPEQLAPAVSASIAIRLALEAVARKLLTPDNPADAVEMIGWLELPLDDAPALVVCGMNDGFVPSSLNSDLFLPNGLREQLGLEENRRRYARDAYALSVLVHSRPSIRLIVGRHNAQGDPLLPSRLIFATDEASIARRVRSAFEPPAGPRTPGDSGRLQSAFQVPRPRPNRTVDRLRVTAFRDYIACPYRFYLRHVEKLECVTDLDGELTAASFGTLIHSALNSWADSDSLDSTDPLELKRFLEASFDAAADLMFDAEPLPAVRLQREQARLRLEAFAHWQAQHRRAGWRLQHHEVSASKDLVLPSGKKLLIRGQIDRIDFHPERNEWLIIDYKTGDAGDGPDKTHFRRGEWVDLQLPLYRFLASSLKIPGDPAVAYVTLGKSASGESGDLLKVATWTPDQWRDAQQRIIGIADDVAQCRFWPPASEPPMFDDFAAILQEGVFGREVLS